MAELTLGSLFDGLGGWQLAALHNGVRPIWSSEIEAFPMAVTKKHFPDTLQLGDITKLDGAIVPPVDIICAGSPCQGLSISGKGKGLSDERSGLFRKAIDIVRGMRTATNGEYPKFFIWENVPGAFSTNQRHDFQAVLEEITETKIPMPVSGQWAEAGMVRSGKCDIAWRVLDAQYWGVPQRRKRIFLIADFRDKQLRNTAVLFERESVPGDTAPGGNDGQGDAERVKGNIDEASRSVVGADIYNTTNTTGNTTAQNHGGVAVVENKHCEAYAVHENQQACITLKPVANAMQTGGGKPGQGYPCTLQPQKQAYRFDSMAKRLPGVEKMEQYAVDFGRTGDRIQMNATQSKTLLGLAGGGAAKTGWYHLKKEGDNMEYIVRRLTPIECERLQGLPDNFTNVECNGKPASDSARYKAIGNGMAQPCADFVLSKVVQALRY